MAEDYQKINKAPQQQKLDDQPGKSATANDTPEFVDDGGLFLKRPLRVHKELKVGSSLVGLTVEEATKKIKEEIGEDNEVIKIQVFPVGFRFCVPRCKPDRVKLMVDSSGRVMKIPYIG